MLFSTLHRNFIIISSEFHQSPPDFRQNIESEHHNSAFPQDAVNNFNSLAPKTAGFTAALRDIAVASFRMSLPSAAW